MLYDEAGAETGSTVAEAVLELDMQQVLVECTGKDYTDWELEQKMLVEWCNIDRVGYWNSCCAVGEESVG